MWVTHQWTLQPVHVPWVPPEHDQRAQSRRPGRAGTTAGLSVHSGNKCGTLLCENGEKPPERSSCTFTSRACQALALDGGSGYEPVLEGTKCGEERVSDQSPTMHVWRPTTPLGFLGAVARHQPGCAPRRGQAAGPPVAPYKSTWSKAGQWQGPRCCQQKLRTVLGSRRKACSWFRWSEDLSVLQVPKGDHWG